jgi:hypothetical protein
VTGAGQAIDSTPAWFGRAVIHPVRPRWGVAEVRPRIRVAEVAAPGPDLVR